MSEHHPSVRVMALHALAYCERLFYLEEVEEIRVANARVFAGRRLHLDFEDEASQGEWLKLELESDALGIRGKVDCLRRRDGQLIPYEHKRGRSHGKGPDGLPQAWESDRLQAIAYGVLVQEATEQTIPEVRIRYHADRKMVRVPLDQEARDWLQRAIDRARQLRKSLQRPPVTPHERRCTHCSLAPVCLPEEERLTQEPEQHTPTRLFPARLETQTLHVTQAGDRIGRQGHSLLVKDRDGGKTRVPIHTIHQVVLHGNTQISTQALGLCKHHHIGVHWLSGGGRYLGAFSPGAGQVQRRIRQFEALRDPDTALNLARKLIQAKVQHQVGFILRTSRGQARSANLQAHINGIRKSLAQIPACPSPDVLRGLEGSAARHHFGALSLLATQRFDAPFHFPRRSRRPPRDRFNALLSFGYALLYRDTTAACLSTGLEPAFGFFHRPRSAAFPLALDLQELFRVPLVDIPLLASLGRQQWDPQEDFTIGGDQVWLSDAGRRKAIALYERRKTDTWRHPALGYSLSYGRLIELEARLLEKEWTGSPGLFARMRLR